MMLSVSRLLTFAILAISLTECTIIASILQSVPATTGNGPPDLVARVNTDTDIIVSTALEVDQKAGATTDAPPDQPAANTTVTAVDGILMNTTVTVPTDTPTRRDLSAASNARLSRRNNSNYDLVFWGTGTGPNDRDAAIEGTAYLTYTVVSNATYDIDDCLAFCDSVEDCVFANLYYEFENPLLDLVFSQGSNLKCALYSDIHNATEKTNFGGQQLYPAPAPLNYIQQSSGWAAKSLVEPQTPPGYTEIFGPTSGANNAPGYMGFAFLSQYDVQACADLCNTRGPDPVGGACQYFNIWRALVDGIPTTYTCAMYYIIANETTAVNFGQGDLVVTESRGYGRQQVIIDGGFEGFSCPGFEPVLCFNASYAYWVATTPAGGDLDASICEYEPYAHSGHSIGFLGSPNELDTLSGTLSPSSPIQTEAGVDYTLQFFLWNKNAQATASLQVIWNGQVVDTLTLINTWYTGQQYTVTAQGNDILQFVGSPAPAFMFIDDVALFPGALN